METPVPTPAWVPTEEEIKKTNLFGLMEELGFSTYAQLFKWSVQNRAMFWEKIINRLGILFKTKYSEMLDLSDGIENPHWLVGAKMNIAESCFTADSNATAIVFQREGGKLESWSYEQLNKLSNRVANGLVEAGFVKGDRVAIDMTMTAESVAIYLGIVKAGCVVVSIADSFAAEEIKTRLRISEAKAVFTQDHILRGGKKLPMYQKISEAGAPMTIVLPCEETLDVELRKGDIKWKKFVSNKDAFEAIECAPDEPINLLFSSGTTGDPKAIPWTHLTPIKSAGDGYCHQDIHPGEVVVWPTNLGWMMGPWLIFASLLNKATIALYYGIPTGKEFGEFVQKAQVNMLGLVPSVVKVWKQTGSMEGLDWSAVKLFSSTGECSNAEDCTFLMSLANNRPVIEYCGGTEIGGGYITGTLVQPASPATFTTPTLGLDIVILDEKGDETNEGELFIIGPSIGLSTELLNRDHHEVYYQDTPSGPDGVLLRRHGDEVEKLQGGFYRGQGRADDTMNLGGIKVSSADIERVLNKVQGVSETAAIAVSPAGGGPSELVIYVVMMEGVKPDNGADVGELKSAMQKSIKQELNPLFKIHEVQLIDLLPRTASNKVMRRVLRSKYLKK